MAGEARADIVAIFTGTTPAGANTQFNYTIQLINQNIQSGAPTELITIYDLPGYISGSVNFVAMGFGTNFIGTTSAQFVGITPAGVVVTDNPTINNVTLQFDTVAGVAGAGCANCSLGTLSFLSSHSNTQSGQFAAQAFSGISGGSLVHNQGTVTIPSEGPSQVPEPAAVLLLSTGLAGFGAVMRKWRKQG